MADVLDLPDFRTSLLDTCDGVVAARDELIRLDAAAGDGDLGLTLATGFKAVQAMLESEEFADIGSMLLAVGRELARRAPSTMGTLLAAVFAQMGSQTKGLTTMSGAQFGEALVAGGAAIRDRGQVTVGQRTVLDAIDPSAQAASSAAALGSSFVVVALKAAKAARAGAAETAQMEPQVGRAAWIGTRVVGTPDAGATAWAVMLEAFAESVARRRAIDPQGRRR